MAKRIERQGLSITYTNPNAIGSKPILTDISQNAGQLMRGTEKTIATLQAIQFQLELNKVPFVLHFQEAGNVNKEDPKMEELIRSVFGDSVGIWKYGEEESNELIKPGHEQYTVYSLEGLRLRRQRTVMLPTTERLLAKLLPHIFRQQQRAANLTSFDLTLPDGQIAYLVECGFHFDIPFTPKSSRAAKLQAIMTRQGINQLIEEDRKPGDTFFNEHGQLIRPSTAEIVILTLGGDGNTHGPAGSRQSHERLITLQTGLGPGMNESTRYIRSTATLSRSIEQEILHPDFPFEWLRRPARVLLNSINQGVWGYQRLDHQFYMSLTGSQGDLLAESDVVIVVANHAFYSAENSDHTPVGTLYGIRDSNLLQNVNIEARPSFPKK